MISISFTHCEVYREGLPPWQTSLLTGFEAMGRDREGPSTYSNLWHV